MAEHSDDEEGWGDVVKLSSPSKPKSSLGKRTFEEANKNIKKKYKCKYGESCRNKDDKTHTIKYSHGEYDVPSPPRKKMKQTTIPISYSTKEEEKEQEESISMLPPQKKNEENIKSNSLTLDDDKTIEITDLPDFTKDEDGFNLEKEEIKLLSEKSFSGEFSDDENLQEKEPPKIEISTTLPSNYKDYWDSKHVKLPCSPQNTYRRKNRPNRYLSRWYLIQSTLAGDTIKNSKELEEAIRSYQSASCRHWDFSGLHAFFRDSLTSSERKKFFKYTLPNIINLALSLPKLFPNGIPMLLSEKEKEITFTQTQLACLLANGFLCTFPSKQGQPIKGETNSRRREYYQSFNFNNLFSGYGDMIPESQAAKWICLLTYFDRIIREPPTHNVTFLRKYIDPEFNIQWRYSGSMFKDIKLEIYEDGFIEDQTSCLQVDFANKMIGGGVLGSGCVQEEIRFMISPELLCSLLFTAELKDTECLIIKGK